jgi:hypothetical protein
MVDLYVRLINENKRTIEEVPERYRAEVQAKLDAQTTI